VSANQHVLYATLANISVAVFGATEAAVRLPAVLFGVAAIFALYYLARILTSESEALWATALLTVMYHHIWFSQNARGWTGVVFFSLLGSPPPPPPSPPTLPSTAPSG
jgi:4-amino-4-deoxy-L-arabinose transferase-like glycosyltransferase